MVEGLIEVAFLNVVATPHPKGVYVRLFKDAAETPIYFWGEHRAAITKPEKVPKSPGFFSFQLVVWVEINPDEPTINKAALSRAAFPPDGLTFTKEYGVNGRVFYCILDEVSHIVTVELRNSDGKKISPHRVETIFIDLLSPEVLGKEAEEVEVTLVPTEGAVEYVLGFKRLDRVEILVKRPNNDDITAETNRVMQRLIAEKAKSVETILRRQAKTDGIELDEDHKKLAEVGAVNGYVKSSGLDEDDVHGTRSTKEVPKIVRSVIQHGASYFAALLRAARDARGDNGQI